MNTLCKSLAVICIVLSGEAIADDNSITSSDDPRIQFIKDAILAERQIIVDAHDEYGRLTKQLYAARKQQDQILHQQKYPTHPDLVSHQNDRLALIEYEQETQSVINRQHQANQKEYDEYDAWLAEQRDKAALLTQKADQARALYTSARTEHDEQAQRTKQLITEYNQKIEEHNGATGSEKIDLKIALATWLSARKPTLAAHREQIKVLHQRALEQHKILVDKRNKLTEQISNSRDLKQQKEQALTKVKEDRDTIVSQRQQEIERRRNALAILHNQIQIAMEKERNDAEANVNALRKSIADSFGPAPTPAEFDSAIVDWLNYKNRDGLFQADGKTPRFDFAVHWIPKVYQALARIERWQTELQQLFEAIRSNDHN